MSRARIELAPGHVLRTLPYRDTSLLVEAWTRDHGRVGLVARGARAPRSKTRALLQPFQPLLLSWTELGDLGSLVGAEARGLPSTLAGETIFSGWYLNELLLRVLHRHDPHPALYDVYVSTLEGLNLSLQPSLRRFEKRLLAEVGYGLNLPQDIESNAYYAYDLDDGPSAADVDTAGAWPGRVLIGLRDEVFEDAEVAAGARRLLRTALGRVLGGKELESARLLRRLRQR